MSLAGQLTLLATRIATEIKALRTENSTEWGKAQCKAASTANLTLSGLQTVDGVVLAANDRVLVKNQTLAQNNGIYLVAVGAWTRATDANTAVLLAAAEVAIQQGTVNGGAIYRTNFKSTGTLGTTVMEWAEAYSDVNSPETTERTMFATGSLVTPPAGESVECTPDGKTLWMKAPDGTLTLIGGLGRERLTSRLTAAAVRSLTAFGASGLTVNVRAGVAYHFKARGQYQAGVTTTGPAFRIGGTATATGIRAEVIIYQVTSNTLTTRQQNAMSQALTGAAGTAVAATDYPWSIEGTIRVLAAGTLTVEFMSSNNTNNITLSADSDFIVEEMS